jgi:ATP-dependent Clp protease ATP-binding subunit ClpC
MERHAVSRLIGSPPGYVGHEEGGQLTEIVRHRPYSLILFDEIEKAHPEVFNILLQILDNGRLTDGKGKAVNFKNSVVIMTSNVGGEYFYEMSLGLGFKGDAKDAGKAKEENFREKAMAALRETFKPEFLNRLDEIIVFNALTPKHIARIVDIQLEEVRERLKAKRITLLVKPDAKEALSKQGFDPEYGARPLKRLIQKLVVDPLADKIIRGEIKHGKKVTVSVHKSGRIEVNL